MCNEPIPAATRPSDYLRPTTFLDCDTDVVQQLAADVVGDADDDRERAVRLFYSVRDGIRYDPYTVSFAPEPYRAFAVAGASSAFCIPKAILLAALGRAIGIPTRLGFADVRNHFSSGRLEALLGTNLFVFHGWTELFLDGRWLKVTPAFNRELCERFGVAPLEFDGTTDALFQPFDHLGRQHLEYVRQRGTYSDLPFAEMLRVFSESYPGVSPEAWRRLGKDPSFH